MDYDAVIDSLSQYKIPIIMMTSVLLIIILVYYFKPDTFTSSKPKGRKRASADEDSESEEVDGYIKSIQDKQKSKKEA